MNKLILKHQLMVWVGVGAVISVLFKKSIHYTNIYSKNKKEKLINFSQYYNEPNNILS